MLFDFVGFVIEDFFVLWFICDKIKGIDFYFDFDLLVDLDDLCDFFGMVECVKEIIFY